MMTSIQETIVKGYCNLFTIHESTQIVVVTTQKKKIFLFHYQSGSNGNNPIFIFLKDISLVEVPKSLFCIPSYSSAVVVIGYKKFYESLSVDNNNNSEESIIPNRILDVEKGCYNNNNYYY
jgi:hypothetical protein